MKELLTRITPKDVPNNPGKPKLWKSDMAGAFLNGICYGVYADLGRAVGCRIHVAFLKQRLSTQRNVLTRFFCLVLPGYFLCFAHIFLLDPY